MSAQSMDIRDVRAAMGHYVVAPVTRPVTHTESEFEDFKTRIEALAKRDEQATRRVRVHLTCVGSGTVITVATTFVGLPPVFHLAGCLAAIPSVAQELIDWKRRW